MENIKKLLDAAKAATGAETDYRLAKNLGIPDQRICDYYKGRRVPDEFACLKIAEAIDMPLAQVIATVKAEAEKDEKRREAWKDYLKRLGGVAASFFAVICASVIFFVTPTPAEAAQALDSQAGMICIMSICLAIAQIKAQLRRVSFPCAFGSFIGRVRQMAA